MARQDAPRKLCGCGRDYIFTSPDRGGKYNSRIDGKQVCPTCAFEEIYNQARKQALKGDKQ